MHLEEKLKSLGYQLISHNPTFVEDRHFMWQMDCAVSEEHGQAHIKKLIKDLLVEPILAEEPDFFSICWLDEYNEHDGYVHLDDRSGGYPCKVNNLIRAHKWTNLAECIDYYLMFKSYDHNWVIKKASILLKDYDIPHLDQQSRM